MVAEGRGRRRVRLAPLTTYKLGGPADFFFEVDEVGTLKRIGEAIDCEPRPVLVLGRGSNLLIADQGFAGVVIRLGPSFGHFGVGADGIVEAGGSLSLPRMARAAGSGGRGGLEWCVGVPGSVGGAVRQNAGCFGSEVVDRLVDAEILSLVEGAVSRRSATDLELSYRRSSLLPTDVVLSARFTTVPVNPETAAAEMRRITRWRRDHQPGGTLNAGSVFKNPPGEAAGAIIDRLGMKEFQVGRVRVSPRHANFIEAQAGSTAGDVHRLIREVQRRVEEETGIRLEPEIQFVGFSSGAG